MARMVEGCPKPQSQQGGAEPETNVSVPQQEGQVDVTRGKAVADYYVYIYYKWEGSDPNHEAFYEKEENSDAEHAKMELPLPETLH